jgi:hypothetical protein
MLQVTQHLGRPVEAFCRNPAERPSDEYFAHDQGVEFETEAEEFKISALEEAHPECGQNSETRKRR